jgi:FlaA1/EpsC-like NDP-sugar epimerase
LSSGQVANWLARFYTKTNQILLDAFLFGGAMAAACLLHASGRLTSSEWKRLLLWLPIVVPVRIAANGVLGVYRLVWRFVSISDAVKITRSIAGVSLLLLALSLAYPASAPWSAFVRMPVEIIALEGLLSLLASLGIRALRRMQYAQERKASPSAKVSKRVFLYGAGRAGMMLRKEMENSPAYEVAGFIDDDPQKVGSVIMDTPVVGNGDDLVQLVPDWRIDEIIVTMATASRATLARTLAKCRRAPVPAKIIPNLQEILSGQVQISELRDTQVEEVLGRESIDVRDFEEIAAPSYRGKRILVTGAGGSIGSELVRQFTRLSPSRLAILDKDENAVYELDQELRQRGVQAAIEAHIADVREPSRLHGIFSQFRPQVVFHAAAHKHVPLMEIQPCEAVLNNVGGTKNVLDVSAEYAVERFVFISTDKAVNPVNVMGATKRIGEMLVQTQLNFGGMRFACVRFGNVLGSRGSVVPLFKKQIADGGPVTVTHPDVLRYFMTIQEAVQLILCAGTLARSGETFVLDMGNSRNILELAREMILLSGLEPEKDIQISITGMRPGEKLTEELVAESEKLSPTSIDKLSLIEPQRFDQGALLADVTQLLHVARHNDPQQLVELLHHMGLGYSSVAPKARAAAAGARHTLKVIPSKHLPTITPQESAM